MKEQQQTAGEQGPLTAVIFDMDGTLVSSTQLDYLSWKRVFADFNRPLTFESYFPLLGKKSADVVHFVLHLEGAAAESALQKKTDYFVEEMEANGIDVLPFVEDLLQHLKEHGLRLALATSSRRPRAEMILERTGLRPYFEMLVTGDEVSRGKPAPDIFMLAAERLRVPAAECVVFEDAASGVQAARSAGMKCVAVTSTHPAESLLEANLVIDSFEALRFPDLCAAIGLHPH